MKRMGSTTRRDFLVAVAGAGVTALARRAVANETVLRLGYISSRSSQLGRGAAECAARSAHLTDGRVRIESYPDSELGGEVDLLQAVARGTLDMAFVTSAVLGSAIPALGIFDIPFLFRDLPHAHTVLDGQIGQQALASFEQIGVIGLAWGENGFRHITTSTRPIKTAADLANLKLRVPQSEIMMSAFKALGADAKPLAFNELYAALATGKFDAQENPVSTITASHFDAVQKHLTLTGHVYSPAVLLISKPAYDTLLPTDQAHLTTAATAGAQVSREQSAIADKAGVDALEAAGMQVVRAYDRASFIKALGPAEPIFVKLFGKDRIDAIRNAAST